jgi:RNA polymerase sigma factor (sigma-70 family)
VDDENGQMSAAQADEIKHCYEANAEWVYGYASGLLGGDRRTHDVHGTAEDLVQDTFMAAARAWETLRSLNEAQKRKWLRTTMLRAASRMGRRNQMFQDLLPAIYDPYLAAQAEAGEQVVSAVANGMILEKVREVIGGLPYQQRVIANMKWIQQMNNKEIAAELGTSPNVVAVQLHTVRQKLRISLGPQYPFAPENGKDGTYDD